MEEREDRQGTVEKTVARGEDGRIGWMPMPRRMGYGRVLQQETNVLRQEAKKVYIEL
jgi:hypothetical protein